MRHYQFDELVGNPVTIGLIKRSLKNGTFKNFSIFSGMMGVGKSTCAGIAAMTLTCENPKEGNPCMLCAACRLNRTALEKSGASPFVKVVNLGIANRFEDVESLIKDVFCLQGGEGRQVYVLEEAHALEKIRGGFTAFLAEIDRMPQNVFVIMCTTAQGSIPRELRSRALGFNFNRLTRDESSVLLGVLLKKKKVNVTEEVRSLIIRHCMGIPRDAEKLLEFVTENQVSEEELRDYLQEVRLSSLVTLFESMSGPDFAATLEVLDNIIGSVPLAAFVDALKGFLVDVLFFLECDDKKDFTSEEATALRQIFVGKRLGACVGIAEKLGKGAAESDVKLAVVKMRAVFQGRDEQSIVMNRNTVAAKERIVGARNLSAERDFNQRERPAFRPLTTKTLDQF